MHAKTGTGTGKKRASPNPVRHDFCASFFLNSRKLDLRAGESLRIDRDMTRAKASKIRESDIVGLKYFGRLMPLLERLHDIGTKRDRAGNRELFFDQYCAYVLLFLFNPIVT